MEKYLITVEKLFINIFEASQNTRKIKQILLSFENRLKNKY